MVCPSKLESDEKAILDFRKKTKDRLLSRAISILWSIEKQIPRWEQIDAKVESNLFQIEKAR